MPRNGKRSKNNGRRRKKSKYRCGKSNASKRGKRPQSQARNQANAIIRSVSNWGPAKQRDSSNPVSGVNENRKAAAPSPKVSIRGWHSRASSPLPMDDGDVFQMSSHEHIFQIQTCESKIPQKFYIYDNRTDKWREFAHFPIDEMAHIWERNGGGWGDNEGEESRFVILPEKRKLYLSTDRYVLREFNMDTKKWRMLTKWSGEDHGVNPLVNVNGVVHCVGALDAADHCILNEEKGEWECIHDLEPMMGFRESLEGHIVYRMRASAYFSMIFVKSKQLILLIGVQDQRSQQAPGSVGYIWSFSTKNIAKNTWQRIEGLTFNFNKVSTVLTADEQFVIISGGRHLKDGPTGDYILSDAIHVLDMRNDHNFILRQSSIRCPAAGECIIFRTGNGLHIENRLIVVGWIRSVFQNEEIKHIPMPSDDVTRLILDWYDREIVHWIFCYSYNSHILQDTVALEPGDHFVIPVQDILSSL